MEPIYYRDPGDESDFDRGLGEIDGSEGEAARLDAADEVWSPVAPTDMIVVPYDEEDEDDDGHRR